jgi:hypothetical protein
MLNYFKFLFESISNHIAKNNDCIPVIIKKIAAIVLVAATGPDVSRRYNKNNPNNQPITEKEMPDK